MTQSQITPVTHLPDLLFRIADAAPVGDATSGDDVEQAVATARRRWPSLRSRLAVAAALVREGGVYRVPVDSGELALVRPPADWSCRAVARSPTGLACSCEEWPPPNRTGPGDGLYCADILAYLLALYLERPLSPLPYDPEELWHLTLGELRLQMTKATFDQWLLGSVVVREASTPLSLTVAVRNRYAQEWLANRLHNVIVRALAAVAGYRVQICYVML
jgi:hypothetical protein